MVKAAGDGTEVESSAGEDTVDEIASEARICFEEGSKVIDVVTVQVRGPCGKSNYKLVSELCKKEDQEYMDLPDANPAIRIKATLLRREDRIAALIAPFKRFPGT